jgi:MSHA biogenesis protein MshN
MSLINKMLQDLEQRHAEGNVGSLSSAVRATPAPQRGTPWPMILALMALLLCAATAWFWLHPAASKPMPVWPAAASHAPVVPVVRATQSVASAPAPSLSLKVDDDLGTSSVAQIPPMEMAKALPPAAVQEVRVSRALPTQNHEQNREQQIDMRRRSEPVHGKLALNKVDNAPRAAHQEPKPAPETVGNIANEQPVTLNKQVNDWTPQQKAENDFRKATTLIQQGRAQEATPLLEQALQGDPTNATARQTLIALMVNAKRRGDAMRLAQQGLELDARQTNFAMILARLQLDTGDQKAAIATLQRSLPTASNNAEYQAFLAALMQREGRHAEAIDLYETALDKAPQSGVWWMGLGISLQADNRPRPAREAFIHARETAILSPDLQAFVEQKIRQLSH